MIAGGSKLLFFAGAGIELSWLYAWANFVMVSVCHRPFPLLGGVGTFALAAALTVFHRGRGWRIIHISGLQTLGIILAGLSVMYVFNYRSYPFFGQDWLLDFLTAPKDPLEWFILVLVLFWTISFWFSGLAFARRSSAYLTICSRFDLGVSLLAVLLLTKFLFLVKGGLEIKDPVPEFMLFPFFLFSLLAIGLVRNQSHAERGFLSGYHGIGVILSFTVVVLLLGSGLVLLFLPYLSAAAEVGYGVLKRAAEPLGPVLVGIIRFIFASRRVRPEKQTPSTEGSETDLVLVHPGESSWWSELLEKILGWGLMGAFGIILLAGFCLALWYLLKWLFSRTASTERREGNPNLLLLLVTSLRAFVLLCWEKMVLRLKGFERAVQVYAALLVWGHQSGLPHLVSETPVEYGLRLKHQFPSLGREIALIIEAFNLEVYGEAVLDERQLAEARSAWRKLRSPLHWPSRLRSWFRQPGQRAHSKKV